MAEPISDARLDEIDGMTSALQWTGCGIQDVRGLVARIRALEAEVATEREARRVAEARAVVEGADAVSARKRTRELNEEVAALRARMEWRLIETAPKDGTRIQLACGELVTSGRWDAEFDCIWNDPRKAPIPIGAWTDGTVADWGMEKNIELHPTHWQPLPTPPAPEGETP